MKKKYWFALAALGATGVSSTMSYAAPVLSINDFIIAIDSDPAVSTSSYPPAEAPRFAIDGIATTKYLNFGKLETGFIVTPAIGSTTIRSLQFTTANDAVARDPASYVLEGSMQAFTQAELTAADNGNGGFGTWTQISAGTLALPAARLTADAVIPLTNNIAYNSYRLRFPTVKDAGAANSMQIAEVGMFESNDGSGFTIFDPFDSIAGFQFNVPDSRFNPGEAPRFALDGSGPQPQLPSLSNSPANEPPSALIDGDVGTKYLNFGGVDSGFIVTPGGGSSQVRSFQLTTANDAPERDPSAWALFGTNQPIVSLNNSYGTDEAWTPIDSGTITMPDARGTLGPVVTVNNPGNFTSYKMLFTGLRDAAAANSMQVAEASFYASTDGTGPDLLNAGDAIIGIDATVRTGLQTKYLNLGEANSGFIVTPAAGAKAVTSLQITTANDFPERDPSSFQIYGTNAPILSGENSQGTSEAWTLIASGALALPDERFTAGDVVSFANGTAYTSYKVLFPTVKDGELATAMQIGGIQFFDASAAENADFDGNGIVDGADLLRWQRGFGLAGQTNNQNGDANGDGSVNAADLVIWKAKFGTAGATAAVGSVPEPATVSLLGLAAAFGGALVRRGRRS
jgi:hypothetical protein